MYDDESTSCLLCSAEFTLWVRRHHCRRCGLLVCHACSPYKIPVEGLKPGGHRACRDCFNSEQVEQGVASLVSFLDYRLRLERVRASCKSQMKVSGHLTVPRVNPPKNDPPPPVEHAEDELRAQKGLVPESSNGGGAECAWRSFGFS